MTDVFISYKKERREHAQRLAALIEANGFDVWWDYELIVGPAYTTQLEQKLREARSVVVLWCTGSRDSVYVQDEARIAQRAQKLLPVLLESVSPPLGFGMDQYANLTTWTGSPTHVGVQAILDGVARLTSRPAKQSPNVLHVLSQLQPLTELAAMSVEPEEDSNSPSQTPKIAPQTNPRGDDQVAESATEHVVEFADWVRRDASDGEWEVILQEFVHGLTEISREDVDANVAIDARFWGERIIVDVWLPRFKTPRRVILQDVGGYANYPGYQLELYSDAGGIDLRYERFRWMTTNLGTKLMLRIVPSHESIGYSTSGAN
ncbi:MAG: hypothetical protein FD124_1708 [Alphaproteobacteria bacterium]|nr:MAG: hypothetical protein FD124_1708 [Alphaproteobacteria bacterium]